MRYSLDDSNCVIYLSKTGKKIGLGNIVIVEYIGASRELVGKFAVVRKASRRKYEFSNRFVFPGGMTRCKDKSELEAFQDRIEELQRRSALCRVECEVGLCERDLNDIAPIMLSEEIYTKYTTSTGLKKITKITAWRANSSVGELNSYDKSVFAARWFGISDLTNNTDWAPANLVILGRYLQLRGLHKNLAGNVISAIDKAHSFCLSVQRQIQGH